MVTGVAAYDRRFHMLDSPSDVRAANDTKQRVCLRCTQAFTSLWAGERICKHCKETSAWRSGVAYKPV